MPNRALQLLLCIIFAASPCAMAQDGSPNAVPPISPDIPAAPKAATPKPAASANVVRASAWLTSQLADTGLVANEYAKAHPLRGAKTALAAWALLSAGADPKTSPKLRRTLGALAGNPAAVRPVAMRMVALGAWDDKRAAVLLKRDAAWLIAAGRAGAWGLLPASDAKFAADTETTFWAALALSEARRRGAKLDGAGIEKSLTAAGAHLLTQQLTDGGWSWRAWAKPHTPPNSYGAMTAGGVVAMTLCGDAGEPKHDAAISRGMAWLAEHVSLKINPRKGREQYPLWLLTAGLVVEHTGQRTLAGRDLLAEIGAVLRREQNSDGSWGYGADVEYSAMATVLLTRSVRPLLVAKLRHRSRWNTSPRDLVNVCNFLSRNYERPVGWGVIGADDIPTDLTGARILYLSGAGELTLTPEQTVRLGHFLRRGGLVVSESVGGDAAFTRSVQTLCAKLLPATPLQAVTTGGAVCGNSAAIRTMELLAASNSIRPLWVHAPRGVSAVLGANWPDETAGAFELLRRLSVLTTDRMRWFADARVVWPKPTHLAKPKRTLRLARLRHAGAWDPEPAGIERLTWSLASEKRIRLQHGVVDAAGLRVSDFPVCWLTGTDAPALSTDDMAALRRYLQAGGTLIIDAAGGGKPMQDWFDRFAATLGKMDSLSADEEKMRLAMGPYLLPSVRYTPAAASKLIKSQRRRAQLDILRIKDRPAVIFSHIDLAAALVGYPLAGLEAYHPDDAKALLANLIANSTPEE